MLCRNALTPACPLLLLLLAGGTSKRKGVTK